MAQILKIKYEGTTRRMSVPRGGFRYSELEQNVRDFFQVPSASWVIITYVDTEGDVVTMGDDQDLSDACVTQGLNPLKLEVKVVSTQPLQSGGEAAIKESTIHTMEFDVEGLLKGLFPESTARAIEQILSRYPPSVFTTVPAHALPEALDTFLKTLTGYRENSDPPALAPAAWGGHLKAVLQQAVHKRISCDRCDMFPIVGPRYKSTKEDDYDLCSRCFLKVRNAANYIKLDRPQESEIHYWVPSLSVKPVKFIGKLPTPLHANPLPIKAPIVEKNSVKDDKGSKRLDAQFVADVTILDETKIEIGTSFTKVWRLKNSGMLPWPKHTRLVQIGGNLFGSSGIVKLKLPKGGLPCGSELDVSVDIKAPKRSAHHVGHWRLMAPFGKMFGDKVWVSIEVVPNTHACEAKVSLIDEAAPEDTDDFFLKTMLESVEGVEYSRKEALINGAGLEHASDSPLKGTFQSVEGGLSINRLTLEVESDEIESNSCLKEPLVYTPGRFKEPLLDFPPLASSHGHTDCFPLAVNELVKECVKDETFTSAEGFELVDSPPLELASEESGLEQYNANTEPLQRSCFEEDDSLTLGGWDYMLKELEEMELDYNLRLCLNLP